MSVLHPLPWMLTTGTVTLLLTDPILPTGVAGGVSLGIALAVGVTIGRRWQRAPVAGM